MKCVTPFLAAALIVMTAAPASPQGRPQRELDRALYEAAAGGQIDGVREMLVAGANVNAALGGDGSALIAAARRGHREMARLLLDRGANPDTGSEGDGSPLIAASARGQLAMMEFLLVRGAELELVVRGDENALISACEYGQLASARWLVQHGADVNARVLAIENYRGVVSEWRTPLSMARRSGHAAIVSFLLSAGARE